MQDRRTIPHETRFPVALVYRDTKSPQAELPDHQHDWYELVYVYNGQGTFLIDQSLYTMREGDLFLIPGGTIHHAQPDELVPVTSTALFFLPSLLPIAAGETDAQPLAAYAHASQRRHYRLSLAPEQQQTVADMLHAIQQELHARHPGYQQAVRILCLQLLLTVFREQRRDASAASPPLRVAGPAWMQESLRHIDTHPSSDLGLANLAHRASVSAAHYSRVFKQLTGMTVSDYVTAKRMQRATELLLHTDHPVKTIAELCGMASMPYFHRMFQRYLGTTPLAYKKKKLTPGQE